MKYVVFVIVAISLVLGGIAIGQNSPRFEEIYKENVGGDYNGFDLHVIHDRGTKQEIVCVVSTVHYSPSCFLSGRKW